MREIGSEFWLEDIKKSNTENQFYDLIDFGMDNRMLFSGRTAIDFVLQDINKTIRTVYMPSYACYSMLQPFISRQIKIEFYDVLLNDSSGLDYKVDFNKNVDIFFAISYFGYEDSFMDSIVNKFRNKDVIVIEDITHRLLNSYNHSDNVDYYIASLRKWFPLLSGGIAIKHKSLFKDISMYSPSKQVIENKKRAMELKAKYIEDPDDKKKTIFLEMFSEFNRSVSLNYENTKMDTFSKELLLKLDINKMKQKRKYNAKMLHNYIYSKKIRTLFKEIKENDCPLFVPIIVENNFRNLLRKYLINNRVYCPIHWPIFNNDIMVSGREDIYHQELSLICDHRYGPYEINRIIKLIGEFDKQYD